MTKFAVKIVSAFSMSLVLAQSPAMGAEANSGKHALVIEKELESIDQAREKFEALSDEEKAKAKKEANSLAAIALVLFRAKKYDKASEKFAASLEKDPTNDGLYQQYAISLIKSKKYAQGLAYLRLTKNTKPIQRFYYFADAFKGLKKDDMAISLYDGVKSTGHKRYAPSAAFQKGLLLYKKNDFSVSKDEFEYVLDSSQDPRLDQRAENYIERILRSQRRKKAASKKYSVNGFVGLQYDSNILFNPDNVADQGAALNDGGLRYLLAGSGKARFFKNEKHKAAFSINAFYLKSAKQEFERADPFLFAATLPYTYKDKLFGKTYQLLVTPGYEVLYLDANVDNQRENIQSSAFVDLANTFVMSKKWIATYTLKLRSDDSKLVITDAADDASAKKISLLTNQTLILGKGKVTGGSLGFTLNAADGDNNDYGRADLSAFYSTQLPWWKLSWTSSLGAYRLDYSKRTDNRKDTNFNASTGVARPITKWMKASIRAGYTKNNSNVAANQYTQWNVMTALSFDKAF